MTGVIAEALDQMRSGGGVCFPVRVSRAGEAERVEEPARRDLSVRVDERSKRREHATCRRCGKRFVAPESGPAPALCPKCGRSAGRPGKKACEACGRVFEVGRMGKVPRWCPECRVKRSMAAQTERRRKERGR